MKIVEYAPKTFQFSEIYLIIKPKMQCCLTLDNSAGIYLILGCVSPEYNFDRKAKRLCES